MAEPRDSESGTGRQAGDSGSGTVAQIAELYLGNLLYALERCAMALHADGDADGAAYYRGLARALAEARGRYPLPRADHAPGEGAV